MSSKFLTILILINCVIFSILLVQENVSPSKARFITIGDGTKTIIGKEIGNQTDTATNVVENKNAIDSQYLTDNIVRVIQSHKGSYGVVIRNLNTNENIVINGQHAFIPASLIKVPFAMLVLSDTERERFRLDNIIYLKNEHKVYSSDYLYSQPEGSAFTIDRLLTLMLRYSDNTAMNMIYQTYYSTDEVNSRFKIELGLSQTTHAPFITTAIDMEKVFYDLYTYSFLSKENSEFILNELSNVPQSFNDRIVAGLPPGTRVAHKIGNLTNVYQDAGIVYSPKGDYIIVILANEVTYSDARNVISTISKMTWDYEQSQ